MPFGFPSGEELVSLILTMLEGRGPAQTPLERLRQAMMQPLPRDCLAETVRSLDPDMLIDDFREALFYSGRRSIDTFLEHNPQFLAVGRMAIGSILVPLEDGDVPFSVKPNWYKLLFENLNTRFEDFAANNLAILTYNYDRSLEHFLLTALRHSYQGMRNNYTQCWEQLSMIPIIHLHGSLGTFPHSPDEAGVLDRAYEPVLNSRALDVCAQGIRVISQDITSEPQFQEAHNLLRDAEVVCFLGFGWDPTNISRLIMNSPENFNAERKFYGTGFHKGRAERNWIHTYFSNLGGIELGDYIATTIGFLGDFPVLFLAHVTPLVRNGPLPGDNQRPTYSEGARTLEPGHNSDIYPHR